MNFYYSRSVVTAFARSIFSVEIPCPGLYLEMGICDNKKCSKTIILHQFLSLTKHRTLFQYSGYVIFLFYLLINIIYSYLFIGMSFRSSKVQVVPILQAGLWIPNKLNK